MIRNLAFNILLALNLSIAVPLATWAQEAGTAKKSQAKAQAKHKDGNHAAEENKKFLDPALDVEGYVKRFESNNRDIYAKRAEIVKSLKLQKGQAVADVGAGTGLFSRIFAEQVGPGGKVYAVDISPSFVKYIGERVKKDGQTNMKPILGTQDSPLLEAESVDLIFACATYHHFEKPEIILASFNKSLKPGGRLVVIDFEMKEGASEFVKGHARAPLAVYLKEMAAAGFENITEKSQPLPNLSENFFVILQKK